MTKQQVDKLTEARALLDQVDALLLEADFNGLANRVCSLACDISEHIEFSEID